MNDFDPADELDSLLRDAMQSREIPGIAPNLAQRAMARAAVRQTQPAGRLREIARQRSRGMMINLLAAAVVFGLIVLVTLRISTQSSSSSMVEEQSDDSSWTQSGEQVVYFGGSILVGAALLLAIERVLSADEKIAFLQ